MLFTPRPKGLGKDAFLKLADQEEVTGIFRGDIHTFRRHWVNNKSVECSGDACFHCKTDPESFPSFRFRINFITSKEGQWTPKIFEGGGEIYDLLTSLDKKFDLSKTIVEITRHGLKQSTKYTIIPMVQTNLTPEDEKALALCGVLALKHEEASDAKI